MLKFCHKIAKHLSKKVSYLVETLNPCAKSNNNSWISHLTIAIKGKNYSKQSIEWKITSCKFELPTHIANKV